MLYSDDGLMVTRVYMEPRLSWIPNLGLMVASTSGGIEWCHWNLGLVRFGMSSAATMSPDGMYLEAPITFSGRIHSSEAASVSWDLVSGIGSSLGPGDNDVYCLGQAGIGFAFPALQNVALLFEPKIGVQWYITDYSARRWVYMTSLVIAIIRTDN
ncbi:MAG: hypothetical protein ACOYM2_20480 [Rectinemataceae bacterium]